LRIKKYRKNPKVDFSCKNILNLDFQNKFDVIVSFETIEHLNIKDIPTAFNNFHLALKSNGKIIFSTPYNQEKTQENIDLGFHQTFYIIEETIQKWMLEANFKIESIYYQNYQTHSLTENMEFKEFIICVANKID
jgi:2-polyprenyl-3-methyl-5-hydroxy-6-metoxy-1,4-benzoquinol methylase